MMMPKNNPELQVLICTLGAAGLERVAAMDLPEVEGVGYVVSVQSDPLSIPEKLLREDVEVFFTPTVGLSRNRNHGISKASAKFALIADDDLIYTPEGLKAVVDTMKGNPEVDVALFRCNFPFEKSYPDTTADLPIRKKGYYITSYEIAFKVDAVRDSGVRFPENMGIGAERFHSGEEAVFIDHALQSGLKCRFFPITVVSHPGIPTGRQRRPTPGVLQADGVLIAMHYGLSIPLRLGLKAWRAGGNIFRNFYYLTIGAMYYLRHKDEFSPYSSFYSN